MFEKPMPRLIAHRGGAVRLPENSLAAFYAVGEAGYWAMETDIRRTRDGEFVCLHNATVDDMYDGSGAVEEKTLEELLGLRIKDCHCPPDLPDGLRRMPTFEEYLKICRDFHVIPFIESKCEAVEELLRTAFSYFSEEEIIFSSVSFGHLKQARKFSSQVFLHHIFSNEACAQELAGMGRAGVSFNYPDPLAAPADLVRRIHGRGLRICLRAGDTPEAVELMTEMGLDYIPTNRIAPSDLRARV